METKMRVKLYGKDEKLISDRLVEQATELRVGAKFSHDGPFSLEINFRDREDARGIIKYIKQITGALPIDEKRTYTKKTKVGDMLKEKEPLQDLYKTILAKCTSQEKIYEYLSQYQYTFLPSDIMEHVDPGMFQLDPRHKKYQFLVRLVKLAKDPANDKYDYRLVVGMKILGKKVDKVVFYLWGKFKTRKNIPWDKPDDINFKKVAKIGQFPEYMTYEDRKKWRAMHRKWENNQDNPDYTPPEFYTRWKPYITGY